MDLMTLSAFLMLVVSALGVDAAMHPSSVILEVSVPPQLDVVKIDTDTVYAILSDEVAKISTTRSILTAPEILVGGNKGVGMAIAEAAGLRSLAVSFQSELGYVPERIRISLLSEKGAVKVLVSGNELSGRMRRLPFQELFVPQPDESIVSVVHRAAVFGVAKIEPYFTALYLIEAHAQDHNFAEVEGLIEQVNSQLPPTPVNFDRSLLENLQGIIQLSNNKPIEAAAWFHRAAASDPEGDAPLLNGAFVDVQQGRYREATEHMDQLLSTKPPTDETLLCTAYMTWGAALVGLQDPAGADAKLARATEVNPESATAWQLWSEIKRMAGDSAAADALHAKALKYSAGFENYAEVAALYFKLAWSKDQPIVPNEFSTMQLQQSAMPRR
jgi:tetratricopeptide (TPR) repeat protein